MTRQLITNIQWTVTHWMLQNGMSIGIGDAVADRGTMEKIKEVINQQKARRRGIITLGESSQRPLAMASLVSSWALPCLPVLPPNGWFPCPALLSSPC